MRHTWRDQSRSLTSFRRDGSLWCQAIASLPEVIRSFTVTWDWLREVHPGVFAEIKPQLTTHLPSEPESMRRMLEYVDEFLAQSDEYPIGGDT